MNSLSKIVDNFLKFGILAGAILRVFQFFYNRSLWYDEAAVAVNIINRDFSQLLLPLEYNQIAPILFLWSQKLMTLIFNDTDWSLRIIPLIAGLGCIWLTFRVGQLILNKKVGVLAAAIVSLSHPLIYYSTEAKPYILDQFFTLLALLFFIQFLKNRNQKTLLHLWIAGIIGVGFSFPIVFCLFSYGLILLHYTVKKKTDLRFTQVLVFSSWAILFFILKFFVLKNHGSDGKMDVFWTDHFAPFSGNIKTMVSWYLSHSAQNFYTTLGFPKLIAVVPIGFSMIGFFHFFKKGQLQILLVLVLPVAVHLIISGFHLFPFVERLNLYFAPIIAILIGIGVLNAISSQWRPFFIIPITLCLTIPLVNKFPFQREEIKPNLAYLSNHISEGQGIYVYYGAKPSFEFYFEKYFKEKSVKTYYGLESRENQKEYKREIESIKNIDWIIFSHIYSKEINEENYIVSQAKRLKMNPIQEKTEPNSTLYKIGNN